MIPSICLRPEPRSRPSSLPRRSRSLDGLTAASLTMACLLWVGCANDNDVASSTSSAAESMPTVPVSRGEGTTSQSAARAALDGQLERAGAVQLQSGDRTVAVKLLPAGAAELRIEGENGEPFSGQYSIDEQDQLRMVFESQAWPAMKLTVAADKLQVDPPDREMLIETIVADGIARDEITDEDLSTLNAFFMAWPLVQSGDGS